MTGHSRHQVRGKRCRAEKKGRTSNLWIVKGQEKTAWQEKRVLTDRKIQKEEGVHIMKQENVDSYSDCSSVALYSLNNAHTHILQLTSYYWCKIMIKLWIICSSKHNSNCHLFFTFQTFNKNVPYIFFFISSLRQTLATLLRCKNWNVIKK